MADKLLVSDAESDSNSSPCTRNRSGEKAGEAISGSVYESKEKIIYKMVEWIETFDDLYYLGFIIHYRVGRFIIVFLW